MIEKIVTEYWLKPIPIRSCDWSAWIDGQEENGVVCYGCNEKDAIQNLMEMLEQ